MSSPNIIYFKGKSWNLSKAYYTINNITYQALNETDIIRQGDYAIKGDIGSEYVNLISNPRWWNMTVAVSKVDKGWVWTGEKIICIAR